MRARSVSGLKAKSRRLPLMLDLEGLESRRLFSFSFTPGPTLVTPNPNDPSFGSAIATNGSLALVSSASGAVGLYDTSTGALVRSFIDPNGDANAAADNFGQSVAFVGSSGILIGAPGGGPTGTDGGTAWYYPTSTSDPVPFTADKYVGYNPATSTGSTPFFGNTVASYHGHLLVACQVDPTNSGNGTAYEIDPATGAVINSFSNPDRQAYTNDQFGIHLAVAGDQILFTAYDIGADGSFSGTRAFLYDGSNFLNNQGQVHEFTDPTNNAAADNFGSSIAFDGSNVVIGDPSSTNVNGAVYQFDASSGSLLRTYALPADAITMIGLSAAFGSSVAINGNTLAIAANNTVTPTASNTDGTLSAFDLTTGNLLAEVTSPDPVNGATFGDRLAALGTDSFIISDIQSNTTAAGAGIAYVYTLQDTTPPVTQAPPPIANAGPDFSAFAGDTVSFSGNATLAPGATASSWDWDFNYDGVNFVSQASGQNATNVFTATGTYTVALQVTDSLGHTGLDTATVTINAKPPTDSAGPAQSAITGQTVNFAGSATAGVGASIVSYAWDFNYNGTFADQADGANASTVYTAGGTYTVALLATDNFGQTALSTTTVTVTVPAPVAGSLANVAAVPNEGLSFTGSATPGVGASIASYAWDFNYNGSTFNPTATGQTVSDTYTAAGTYTVAMQATDSLGQVSGLSTCTVTVTANAIVNGDLYIGVGNTASTNNILLNSILVGFNVVVGGNNLGSFSPTGNIYVFGGSGNNVIAVSNNIKNTVIVFGGPGNDLIKGGSGSNILVGGDGNDTLIGGSARDILIGGNGADHILGAAGDDILIAGSTSFDNNPAALLAILAEWNSSASYSQRVADIQGSSSALATRLNGNYFLQNGTTVFDDAAPDILAGNAGTDWFLFNDDKGTVDKVLDYSTTEIQTDIDSVPPTT